MQFEADVLARQEAARAEFAARAQQAQREAAERIVAEWESRTAEVFLPPPLLPPLSVRRTAGSFLRTSGARMRQCWAKVPCAAP